VSLGEGEREKTSEQSFVSQKERERERQGRMREGREGKKSKTMMTKRR
jgi:hypothetical protein